MHCSIFMGLIAHLESHHTGFHEQTFCSFLFIKHTESTTLTSEYP